MTLAQEVVRAHAGEEGLFILIPVVIVVVFLLLSRRDKDDEDGPDEP